MNISDRFNKSSELKSLKEQVPGLAFARYGEFDIAYPASEEEYCILGSHGIVMVTAISDTSSELPIESVYFKVGDKIVASFGKLEISSGDCLLGDVVTEKKDDAGRVYFENISFWVVPLLWFLVNAGVMAIDFKGERKGFVMQRGPWNLDSRVMEWISKHAAEQLKVTEHVTFDVLAEFIEREFFANHRFSI
jgi:hypothetical protein